jgi:hypothetical protein
MIFSPKGKDRERCPIIARAAVGGAILERDQKGVFRIHPGDRVRLVEVRGEFTLCEHVACKEGLLLIGKICLEDESL